MYGSAYHFLVVIFSLLIAKYYTKYSGLIILSGLQKFVYRVPLFKYMHKILLKCDNLNYKAKRQKNIFQHKTDR